MDWNGTPGLYQSPGFTPPNWLLPPTPDDGSVECNEISTLSPSPAIWHPRPSTAIQYDHHPTRHYQQALPMLWLAGGELKNLNPELHPGLRYMASTKPNVSANVLGKRPVFDSPDSAQQPPAKTIRTSPVDSQSQAVYEEEHDMVYGEPHVEIGLIGEKHCCSCGKNYTRAFRLRQHVEVQAGNARFPCLVCGMGFGRLDSLRRHEETKHKGKKIACPGCDTYFRPDYLTSHLRGSKNAKCRVVAHAIYLQSSNDMDIDTRPPAENYWIPNVLETLKQRHLTGRPQQPTLAIQKETPTPEALAKILMDDRPSHTRPLQRRTREPCDLCGLPLGPGEKELIDHIDQHSLDFLKKTFRCDECGINFAYQADLEMHMETAAKGHCGFSFYHFGERSKRGSNCTGHHPQQVSLGHDDHKRMQQVLWAWENCQLRAHRATIARLLAERLQYTQVARHSIANDEISCIAILSRLSMRSIQSFHSVPARMEYKDKIEIDDLDTEFSALGLLSNETIGSKEESNRPARARARPESTVLGLRNDVVDFTMELDFNGKLKPVLRGAKSSALWRPTAPNSLDDSSSTGPKNTYIEQIRSMGSPGGLKTRASGVRYRATKAYTRYVLPANRSIQETSLVQYANATSA